MPSSRQLAAIMFTDIAGYMALMDYDEQKLFSFLHSANFIEKITMENHLVNKTALSDSKTDILSGVGCFTVENQLY
ncbi:MAG: hypothetical protein WDO19_27600 [Bacteroidota bacterium]